MSKIESSQIRYLILGFVFSILFLLSVLFLVFVSFNFLSIEENESVFPHTFYDYQIYEYNPLTNESSLGLVSISRQISKEGYEFSVKENGNLVLISEFGSEEYICNGICYCEEFERRNTGTVLQKPIIFFVAALTSAMAYNCANEYFHNQCEEEFDKDRTSCDHSSIRSEVAVCKKTVKKKKKNVKEDTTNDNVEVVDDDEEDMVFQKLKGYRAESDLTLTELEQKKNMTGEFRKYLCTGRCEKTDSGIEFLNVLKPKKLRERLPFNKRCKLLDMGIVEFTVETSKDMPGKESNEMAKEMFAQLELDPFCRRFSDMKVHLEMIKRELNAMRQSKVDPEMGSREYQMVQDNDRLVNAVERKFPKWYDNHYEGERDQSTIKGSFGKIYSWCKGEDKTKIKCRRE